jgi:tetratricopeptide (TPR) repeat protein
MKLSVAEKVPVDKIAVEKFNVAWFKLAEFVGRKEKERALGVYRLLSHSLPDDAFAAQLEGDLFMAFHDEKALDAYQRSAKLYEKNGQLTHAAFIYEQMILIKPENREYLIQALKLYEVVKNDAKVVRCASQLARILIKNGAFDAHQELMTNLVCAPEYQLYAQEWSVIALIEFQPEQQQLIQDYLIVIVRALESVLEDTKRLTLFLAKLSALDTIWYEYSYQLLKSDK